MTASTRLDDPGFATLALHAGAGPSEGAVALEERVAVLEGGTAAVATGSGASALMRMLHALLDFGDGLLVASGLHTAFGPLLVRAAEEFGWTVTAIEPDGPGTVADAVTAATRVVLVESLTADGRMLDLGAMAETARASRLVLVVDNTRATPALVRPIERGAHVVVHSGAALLAGRGDVDAGLVIDSGADWTQNPKLSRPRGSLGGRSFADRYGNFALVAAMKESALDALAPPPPPSTAAAVLAGLATLTLRLDRRMRNAGDVARHLAGHPAVESVGDVEGPILRVRFKEVAPSGNQFQLFSPMADPAGLRSAILHAAGDRSRTIVPGLEDAADLIADLDQALAGTP